MRVGLWAAAGSCPLPRQRGFPAAHAASHLRQACRKPTTSASTCSHCRPCWKRWSKRSTPRWVTAAGITPEAGCRQGRSPVLPAHRQLKACTLTGTLLRQLQSYIDRVLYTVCLTWVHSEHYSTPSRVIIILQEICNLLIEMVLPGLCGAEPPLSQGRWRGSGGEPSQGSGRPP